ncbi:MAG: Pr6Pr family membrane protein [Clostridiales bacterium]|nr:Pr6Pr family membrane protein [Clostridiales bacterium]
MIKNKPLALAYRAAALLFALTGLLSQLGIFSGEFHPSMFLYYTLQSNVLAVVLFAMLTTRTAISLREGKRGSAAFFARFEMVCACDLLITFAVYWVMLAPILTNLWQFANIAVHGITPLLCLLDYLLFATGRRLKYRDVYYVCIFPLLYVVFAVFVRFTGYLYRFPGAEGETVSRYPYYFLDFDTLGAQALLYIGAILIFFLLLGHGLYLVDRKAVRKFAGIDR